MLFEASARNGVELLSILIETAQHAQARGRGHDLSDALAEALDVVRGACAPHLRIRPAEPPVSWFTAADRTGALVIERRLARPQPNTVIACVHDPSNAQLLAQLLTAEHARPRGLSKAS